MTAAQSSQGAPPPPVTSQKAGAVQGCPYKAKPPCDVTKLVVTATVTAKPPVVRQLAVTDHAFSGVPRFDINHPLDSGERTAAAGMKVIATLAEAADYDPDVPVLLNRYDLVIDTIADYVSTDMPTPVQRVEVATSHELEREPCPAQRHPWMSSNVVHTSDPEDRGALVKAKQLPMHEYVAQSSAADRFTPTGDISAFFSVFSSMLTLFEPPKHIEILADSCGARASGAPNIHLLGLVRVFRNDSWLIKLTIPPLFKAIEERAKTLNLQTHKLDASQSSSQQSGNSGKTFTHTTSKDPLAPGVNVVTTQETGAKVVHGQASTHSLTTKQLGDEKAFGLYTNVAGVGEDFKSDGISMTDLKDPVIPEGFNIVVQHNTRNADIRKLILAINGIVAFARKAKSWMDVLKVVPQLGWKVTATINVMQGNITAHWYPSMEPKIVAGGRYYPVKWRFSLDFQVILFDFSFILSFGFEVIVGPKELQTGAAVKVDGTVGLTVPLKESISVLKTEITLTPTATCSLTPQAYVTVLGWTVFDARIGVKGGLEMPDGKIIVDHGIRLQGTLRRSKVGVAGSITGPYGDPYGWTETLLQDSDLYKIG
jgi:hypothetical protein